MATQIPTASATFSFSRKDRDASDDGAGVVVALEDSRNGGATAFSPGGSAYVSVAPTLDGYTIASSAGTLTKDGTRIPVEVSEDLIFAGTREATLDFPPNGAVSYEWLGKDGGTPLFNGQTVTIPEDAVGVLRVTYDTLGDRLRLEVTDADMGGLDELPVVVAVTDADGNVYHTTVNYTRDGEDPAEPEAVEILVEDFCTGEPISGATVLVNGKTVTTNANGVAYVGTLAAGTYAIKATATGYTDSDKDVLNNDSFVVG